MNDPAKKPFPWPLGLALLGPVILLAAIGWAWSQEDFVLMARSIWVAAWSLLPGFSIMVIIGSFAQLRQRPRLSSISLILGLATPIACYWLIQKLITQAATFLE